MDFSLSSASAGSGNFPGSFLFTPFGNPFPKGTVAGIVLGDNAMPILLLKFQKL